MNKRNKLDPQDRKQQIIDAAAAVFARKGFHLSSMDDIVRESGLSKGGLYWHFKSKDDIITAVLDRFFTSELSAVSKLFVSPLPVSEKIRQLFLQMMTDSVAQLSVYLNIWLEFYALAARESSFRNRLLMYLHQFIDMLTGLIQLGIDDGEFRQVDAGEVALTASAQFEGLILLWAIEPDKVDVISASETAVELLLKGLRKEVSK